MRGAGLVQFCVAFHSNRAEGQLVVLLKDIVPAAAGVPGNGPPVIVDPIQDQPPAAPLITAAHDLPQAEDQPPVIRHRQPPWVGRYRRSLMITDSVIIVGVVLASQSLRVSTNTRVELEGLGSISYWIISAILSLAWLAALAVNGAWDRKILGAGPNEYARIMRASFYLFGFVAIVAYLARAELARSYLLIALPLGLFGLVGGRWVWRRLLAEYRRAGSHLSSVLVVGGTASVVDLADRLRNAPDAGFRVAGLCLPGGPSVWTGRSGADDLGFPVVGDVDDVPAAVDRTGADMVAVASSEAFGSEEVRRLAWRLEGSGVAIALVPALTDVAGPRIHIRPVAGLPLMYVEEPRFKGPKLVAKTMVDVVGAVPRHRAAVTTLPCGGRGDQAGRSRTGVLPATTRRIGRCQLSGLEIPLDDPGRRYQRSTRLGRTPGRSITSSSNPRPIRGSPPLAALFAGQVLTSSRSCSMCWPGT